MDAAVTPESRVRVLLEMRPALDKHAGIPQQTRLLFRGLAMAEKLYVEGLIQSSTHALDKGIPTSGRTWRGPLPKHRQIDRLARIVIMLEQKFLRSHLSAANVAARRLTGRSEELTCFDPKQFRDFIWRRLFARSLPSVDFDTVTNSAFRVARNPWTAMHICGLVSGSVGFSIFPRLNTAGFDVMVAETPYPGIVRKRTRLVVRYHDAIPLLMPHTIADRRQHQAFHYGALRRNVESGAWFVCVSETTRKDLLSIFPQVERRTVTIHNIVSHDYFDEPSRGDRVSEIVKTRGNPAVRAIMNRTVGVSELKDLPPHPLEYLLIVSTIEPRKNHLTLLSAWEKLKAECFPALKLVVVGSLGWQHGPIVRKLRPWIARGEVFMLEDVPSAELRLLYKHARATICPSFAEGFDLSGVEAMMSGGAVVASDIAVHREVYANGAEYVNPYSGDDLVSGIRRVIDCENARRREELVGLGAANARRYLYEEIIPRWQDFLVSTTRSPA